MKDSLSLLNRQAPQHEKLEFEVIIVVKMEDKGHSGNIIINSSVYGSSDCNVGYHRQDLAC